MNGSCITLEQWLAGTGSGTYTVDSGAATLDLTFQSRVPNATYTLWCSRLTRPPKTARVDAPCGASDGSQNAFTTDATGSANFNLSLAPLPESSAETLTVLAVAYHSDGESHGASPGDFGLNSHVQIFFAMPQAATTTAATN